LGVFGEATTRNEKKKIVKKKGFVKGKNVLV
jgi:hypothetical protein